jgi:LPXTG-site transpeptidase (sortase) family protein
VIHKFTDDHDYGQDVIVQSDGKIVVSSDCNDLDAYCLARFYGEDQPFSTGVSGGVYNFEGGTIIIPAGALPSGPDADANACTLNINIAGHASLFNIQLDEYVWDITIECDGKLVTLLLQPITVCLVPKDGVTTGKQQYSRHAGESLWNPLPLVQAKAGMVCGTTSRLSLFIVGLPDYPLTGFAPGAVTELAEQPAAAAYAATDMQLSIPELGVETGIVGVPQTPEGWDVSWLGGQAGYLYGSAYPTWEGHTVLTAHVWGADNQPGPFYGLKDLQHGDQITISYFGQIYTYEVRSNRLITPRGAAQFEHSEYDLLTLITCESFDLLSGDYRQRRVVTAVLIRVD